MVVNDWVKENFPERLRTLREAIGVSQEEMANKLGISRPTLTYYEAGKRLPDIQVFDEICQATGCAPEYLLGYQEEMNHRYADLTDRLNIDEETLSLLERHGYDDSLNAFLKISSFWHLVELVRQYAEISYKAPTERLDKSPQYIKFLCHERLDDLLLISIETFFGQLSDQEQQELKSKWEEWRKTTDDRLREELEMIEKIQAENRAQRISENQEDKKFLEDRTQEVSSQIKTDKFLRFQAKLNNWPAWQRYQEEVGEHDVPQAD